MNFKRKLLASAVGLGLALSATAGQAVIDGTDCQTLDHLGLGEETCKAPDPSRGEGLVFVAAETAVSIASAIADSMGCVGSFDVKIGGADGSPWVSLEAANTTETSRANEGLLFKALMTLGTASLSNPTPAKILFMEKGYDNNQPNGVRDIQFMSTNAAGDTAKVIGLPLRDLTGSANMDFRGAILYGGADFKHGSADLDEHYIKDFYAGDWIFPTYTNAEGQVCAFLTNGPLTGTSTASLQPTDAELGLDGIATVATCDIVSPGDGNPADPRRVVRVIRDNGLEVTTKKFYVPDIYSDALQYLASHPRGKWRQTSHYREPDGPGKGKLTYTKVKIAPYGAPDCAVQLTGDIDGTAFLPGFSGKVKMFPLVAPTPN